MKIAFIGQKGIPVKFGGIERHVDELSCRLAQAGHQVFVYCRPWYTPKGKKEYQGVSLINLPSVKTKHLDAISHTFLATIHALFSGYDIIHYHGVGPSLLSFIPRIFRPSLKVVTTFHCIDRRHRKWGFLARLALWLGERFACWFAQRTITVSKTLQYYCSQIYDRDTIYIPNGVSQKKEHYNDSLIREKFGLEKDNYLVAVSRLVRHKGIHYLIEAYQNIKTDKKLVIVGDSAFTGAYVKKLKKLAGNNKNIIFTGYQDGEILNQLFDNAYCVIHPSESEGLPLAVLEAMSYSKAVLASDIAENLEVVKDHGFTFRNKSIPDLIDKLEYLLSQPRLVSDTGQESCNFVLENYNWDDITAKTIILYRELLGYQKSKARLAEQKI